MENFDKTVEYPDLEEKYKVEQETGYDNYVVVIGLPIVEPAKKDKLFAYIKAKVSPVFAEAKDALMPFTDGKSHGALFVEFETAELANKFSKAADNFRFDKNHTLTANVMTEVDRIMNMEEEFKEPEMPEYEEKGNMKEWLLDELSREQFSFVSGNKLNVKWYIGDQAEIAFEQKNVDKYVWSPLGTYLAGRTQTHVVMCGGSGFKPVLTFHHPKVVSFEFSPMENYLITYSNSESEEYQTFVWDVRTGQKIRGFKGATSFKFSYNDEYVAKVHDKAVFVYKTETMELLEKKSIRMGEIADFEWSPVANIIAFWSRVEPNVPARIVLMKIPTREIIRSKNLFNVEKCSIYWQNKGEFVAFKVDKLQKKLTTFNLEIFKITEKDCPVEMIDLSSDISDLAWEPERSRFVTSTIVGRKTNLSLYELQNGSFKLIRTFERGLIHRVFWSPKGRFCIFAGHEDYDAITEFWDLNTDKSKIKMLISLACPSSGILWEASGRFIVSYCSSAKLKGSMGFKIYDFKGSLLYQEGVTEFSSFAWRPRPPTTLPEDQIKEIKKNLKTYSDKFEEEDRLRSDKAYREVVERRSRLKNEWFSWFNAAKKLWDESKSERIALFDGIDFDEAASNDSVLEDWNEVVIKETIEPYQPPNQ
ncbi:dipeptidyl peptidase IV/CD26, N-terminal domain-containing protein [Rozella allomycis CSF55]|uniref:Eukaryotic translation initiation factor 3 subunit B n=1 Tax=Rozella allomycis (strain CSF55) TaxID=988480 RepID=A0A075ASH6_ROZAC|nr:Translation initiation factor, beta propellor-like domain-containing protein [Rozella allomycis CSF55]RKP19037.1 dipeptidyl peptidase IV/CD26, N-terminal domain-containing protein [Rozella allomycis CSF55]|eukprot:EPZ33236.1 Translation initiation factor, beta propellor-like domain-containing protein [Rozella allomycis CSF55]